MLHARSIISCAIVLTATVPVCLGATNLHHDLSVRLDPGGQSIKVTDSMSLEGAITPDDDGSYRFVLHAGLAPEVLTEGWRLEAVAGPVEADFFGINATTDTVDARVPLEGWRLLPSDDSSEAVQLSYGGTIHHALATQGEEYQRSFSETPGIIGDEGVFLSGTSFWVPTFGDGLMSFRLEVTGLTPPWDVVSQGRRERHEIGETGERTTVWAFEHPTEEVYLVAGPWIEYADRAGKVEVFAFLRGEDPGLAERYLSATKRYLKMYEEMLPRFPFASFALVENFWETGYGMPGFTLLGPQVIRFPWILSSSYPHELLHNWWGNSAYVDFDRGNWCEGLTAYMADHLLAEQRGEAAVYRRSTLKKFTDFVDDGSDLPLVDFSSRRSAATEAVGYGKSLMVFHMIRRAVGDEVFLRSLSRFYDEHQFNRVSFAEIAAAVSAETGAEWGPFMASWTSRTGAPTLAISDAEVRGSGDEKDPFTLHLTLSQTQEDAPFELAVPVAVTVEDLDEAVLADLACNGRKCELEVACPGRPLRVDVDPSFDVMRRLDPLEVPPSLSTIFGTEDALFVLPAAAPEEEMAAWREMAAQWARPGEARTVLDTEVDEVPEGSVWLLGWDNRLAPAVLGPLGEHGVTVDKEGFTLAGDRLFRAEHSLVLVARSAGDSATAVGWVASNPVAAIPGLGRKLPHYTKYSYLAFRGDEPTNVAKGVWPTTGSPLSRALTAGEAPAPALPARSALAELPPAFNADTLLATAAVLADPALEGRGVGSAGLLEATEWVEAELAKAGLEPAAGSGFRQQWMWTGGEPEREMQLTNLLARIPGSNPELADRPVLVMAHLDHLGRGWPEARAEHRGEIHPGADDNASGVAVLLELARTLASESPRARPVVFAVVTGEEAGLLGSRHLLGSMPEEALPASCINLDTVGRLSEGKLYVLNADSAREWRFIFMGVGYTTGAPVSVVSEPLDASDQKACIEKGVPAVQLFTGPNQDYHRPTDTVDKLDGEGLVVVTAAVHETVAYLADRVEPLTVTITGAAEPTPGHGAAGARKVSLGTMPDFGYDGPGVRVQRVMDDSPAAAAGIMAGDVVRAIDGEEVTDLRSYSNILKSRQPGDDVELKLDRNGQELTVRAVLVQR